MLAFYDFAAASGPPSDITFAVQDIATGTSTGDVDYTSATISGLTPVASLAFFPGYRIASEPGEQTNAMLCATGIATTGVSWRIYTGAQDNETFAYGQSSYGTDPGFELRRSPYYSGVDVTGTVSQISGGLRVNYATADHSVRGFYLAFAGANVSGFSQTFDLGSSGTTALTGVGFTADVVFVFSIGRSASNSIGNQYCLSVGIVTHDSGTVVQRCLTSFQEGFGASPAAKPLQALLTSKCGARISTTGALTYDFSLGNFGADGWDFVKTGSPGNEDVQYLALKLTGGQKKLVDFTTPTSTGDQAITGVGFTPRQAFIVLSNLEASDPSFPLTTSDNMSGLSISVVGDEQWSFVHRQDSGSTNPDTGTLVKNVALLGASATVANAIEATLVSFDSDGMTLNYSAVQGTGKKGFILFLE